MICHPRGFRRVFVAGRVRLPNKLSSLGDARKLMLIAILHYHLNRGGVAQVIANHLQALRSTAAQSDDTRALVLHGGRGEGWAEHLGDQTGLSCSIQSVSGLDYDTRLGDHRRLAADLTEVLRRAGGTRDDAVIHVHNHSLGKNPTLPLALGELAREGWPLLLQIHDFAEDFRPDNYRQIAVASGAVRHDTYPTGPHVHYAVLNQRDARVLTKAGLDPAQLHVLPNAVGEIGALPDRQTVRREWADRFQIPQQRRMLLYPVRGIRRKNIGEALLWSLAADEHWHVGLTLAPQTPAECRSYERWKATAAELRLRTTFELGGPRGLPYASNVAGADRMLTTSLAEGFGLVFLESWLGGRPLVGRDLPEITADFTAAGLRLDALRPELRVPVDWIGAVKWRRDFEAVYRRTLAQFGREPPAAGELDAACAELTKDGMIDFGVLLPTHQQRILGQVSASRPRQQELQAINRWIETALRADEALARTVAHNAAVVRDWYSLARCGTRLRELYGRVAASPQGGGVGTLPHAERILDEFLRPERFHPLRVEP